MLRRSKTSKFRRRSKTGRRSTRGPDRATPTPIPVWILGGYLGAGKTTVLNALLRAGRGARTAVLVNDFGSVNVDADLIAATGTDTIELTNGCTCCTIGGDLILALQELVTRGNPPDRIVIEASGVADPRAVARLAACHPALAVRGTIVVADGETVVERTADKYVGGLVRRQLQAADAVVVSKIDLLGDGALHDLRQWLGLTLPAVPVFESSKADDFSVEIVFDPEFIGRDHAEMPPAGDQPAFAARTFRSRQPLDRGRFLEAVRSMLPVVERAKGTLYFADEPDVRRVFQLSGERWTIEPFDVPEAEPESRLVAIAFADRADQVDKAFEKLHPAH